MSKSRQKSSKAVKGMNACRATFPHWLYPCELTASKEHPPPALPQQDVPESLGAAIADLAPLQTVVQGMQSRVLRVGRDTIEPCEAIASAGVNPRAQTHAPPLVPKLLPRHFPLL